MLATATVIVVVGGQDGELACPSLSLSASREVGAPSLPSWASGPEEGEAGRMEDAPERPELCSGPEVVPWRSQGASGGAQGCRPPPWSAANWIVEVGMAGRRQLVMSEQKHGSACRTRQRRVSRVGEAWDTIAVAAAKLDLEEQALRARCRRAARVVDGEVTATLGMGVVARKLGASWRVFVPSPVQAGLGRVGERVVAEGGLSGGGVGG